jgi:hypothetical protein
MFIGVVASITAYQVAYGTQKRPNAQQKRRQKPGRDEKCSCILSSSPDSIRQMKGGICAFCDICITFLVASALQAEQNRLSLGQNLDSKLLFVG